MSVPFGMWLFINVPTQTSGRWCWPRWAYSFIIYSFNWNALSVTNLLRLTIVYNQPQHPKSDATLLCKTNTVVCVTLLNICVKKSGIYSAGPFPTDRPDPVDWISGPCSVFSTRQKSLGQMSWNSYWLVFGVVLSCRLFTWLLTSIVWGFEHV